ncbi:hypothetical protein [Sinomonas soli]
MVDGHDDSSIQGELEHAAWVAAERSARDWAAGRYTPRWVSALAATSLPRPQPG